MVEASSLGCFPRWEVSMAEDHPERRRARAHAARRAALKALRSDAVGDTGTATATDSSRTTEPPPLR